MPKNSDYQTAKIELTRAKENVDSLIAAYQESANKLADWETVGVVYPGHTPTCPTVIYAARVPTIEQIGAAIESWRQCKIAADRLLYESGEIDIPKD